MMCEPIKEPWLKELPKIGKYKPGTLKVIERAFQFYGEITITNGKGKEEKKN